FLCPADFNWDNKELQNKPKSSDVQATSDLWSVLIYANYNYNRDDPWKNLLCSNIFVSTYKHVFLLLSSADSQAKPCATCSSNAYLHGTSKVTLGFIVYIARQVCFALPSQSIFSCTNTVTDSEGLFNSILSWWNK
ncbi:hypothetical protein SERLA73DRAFT_44939, partial [Serpula lacrymans var. lacrymans S7.3]